MKYSCSYLFLVLWFSSANAQNMLIEYRVRTNTNAAVTSRDATYTYMLSGKSSLYFNNLNTPQFKYEKNISQKDSISADLMRVKLSDNHYTFVNKEVFYKDYTQDSLIYNVLIANKKFVVAEKIYTLFEWKLIENADSTILGYRCQKAISEFRGRKYVAYFSNQLGFMGGPWKFDGLPGIILYVRSEDNYFVIEPEKITVNAQFKVIANPYRNDKIISWQKYGDYTAKYLRKQLKIMQRYSDTGEGGKIKITDSIEDLGITEISFQK